MNPDPYQLLGAAADRLKKQADRIEALEAALREITKDTYLDEYEMEFKPTRASDIARAALSQETKK